MVMGIYSSLFGNNSSWKETLIKDLIIMSAVDREVDQNEIDVIFNTGIQLGISQDRITFIISNFNDMKNCYPTNEEDKRSYIKALYLMIMADSKIDKNEVSYLKTIAKRLKLSNTTLSSILKELENQKIINNNSTENHLTLKNIVKKRNNLPEGIFANINNDLNDASREFDYSTENADYGEKLILMSYAYARRTVAAGLVLQGIFSIKDFQHAQKIFHSIQIETIHTKEFQELAFSLANQYILSYDTRLTLDVLQKITFPVMQNHSDEVKTAKDLGIVYSYEDIINNIP
jgi:hypothetical protein